MGVGPHSGYLLRLFGAHIDQAFGATAYQVGSSLTQKRGWRDVDVRVLLDDEEYEMWGEDTKRRLHELAWTTLGQQMTGLPIDFQIQRLDAANEEFDGQRSALLLHDFEIPLVRTMRDDR